MKLTVSILGAGESGVGAALLAKAKGFDVFLSDRGEIADRYCQILTENQIAFESGKHSVDRITSGNVVIKSPGIPGNIELVQEIRRRGIPVISEIEFASRYTDAKIIAITGTNGKTTTTLLTYHLLKESGFNVGVGGNIGNSFAAMVVEDTFDYYVLEISSFQLDDIDQFKPYISVLLNITPDHLDRYEYDLMKYMESKFRIAMNQNLSDHFIYSGDIDFLKQRAAKLEGRTQLLETSVKSHSNYGGWLAGSKLVFNLPGKEQEEIAIDELPLYGKHNQLNALTASLIALNLGVDKEEIRKGLKSFKNAPHRMELVEEIDGVQYINDSKATNVDAVFYALDGLDKNIIWIAGGVDKGNEYEQIALLVEKKVGHMICLGVNNKALTGFFTNLVPSIDEVTSMADAISQARKVARPGDVVLLSPACASFDLFNNYIDRGDQFRNEVKQIVTANKNKEVR